MVLGARWANSMPPLGRIEIVGNPNSIEFLHLKIPALIYHFHLNALLGWLHSAC